MPITPVVPALRLARHLVVAIDGPGGSGKSTVARQLAIRLGLRYIDTGATYRALAVAVDRAGVDPADEAAVQRVLAGTTITLSTDPHEPTVALGGIDVTAEIRGERASALVSAVSGHPPVRQRLIALQRALIGLGDAVAEGRDVAAVVAPHAQVKVFLTASADARAARRAAERGDDVDQVKQALAARDSADARTQSRGAARADLVADDDAVTIDTTDLTIEQVVERIIQLIEECR